MRRLTLALTLAAMAALAPLTAFLAKAEEPKKAESPSMEATLGEYSNYLWQQRNALEQEVARLRAQVRALQKEIERITPKPVPGS